MRIVLPFILHKISLIVKVMGIKFSHISDQIFINNFISWSDRAWNTELKFLGILVKETFAQFFVITI